MSDLIVQTHPLRRSDWVAQDAPAGRTVDEIVAELVADGTLDPVYGWPVVTLTRGAHSWEVDRSLWRVVRPSEGARVDVGYRVQGQVIVAAVGSALGSSAAVFTAGKLANTLAVVAVNIVAGLALQALIPPPDQGSAGSEEDEQARRYTTSGTRNRANLGGPVPKVLGRRRFTPPLSAQGWTDYPALQNATYFGRYCLGYGPIALEALRIGETDLLRFDDFDIELINVDYAQTVGFMPWLATDPRVRWVSGSAPSTLYPHDIFTDAVGADLTLGLPVVRATPNNTARATVKINFPRGMFYTDPKDGSIDKLGVGMRFEYRDAAGGGPWLTSSPEERWEYTQRAAFVLNWGIWFPYASRWEVRVTRVFQSSRGDAVNRVDETTWLALECQQVVVGASTYLPTDPDIAEIALRFDASERLQGAVDDLNVTAWQMGRVWTSGGGWSARQAVNHPAWVYLDALTGSHLRRPVADEQIDLPAFEAWAAQEPWWTFSDVVDSPRALGAVLDDVAAAGRARRASRDMLHSVIREPSDLTPRQVITPRNSRNFSADLTFPRELHGLDVTFVSEALGWAEDTRRVYADGRGLGNSTNIEPLRLTGVVIPDGDGVLGNVYRLARYYIAAANSRRETMRCAMDIEHMAMTRGDVVLVTHDVPRIGTGQGRVTAADASAGTLSVDDDTGFATGLTYRLRLRQIDGTISETFATWSAGVLTRTSGDALTGIRVGDLVAATLMGEASQLAVVTGIRPDGDGSAEITMQPLAGNVPLTDWGVIPPYTATVTDIPPGDRDFGPPLPVALDIYSDARSVARNADGSVESRIGVQLDPGLRAAEPASFVRLRWRDVTQQGWTVGTPAPVGTAAIFTDALTPGKIYEVQALADLDGRTRGWAEMGQQRARTFDEAPPDVTGLQFETVGQSLYLRWNAAEGRSDIAWALVRYSANTSAGWDRAAPIDRVIYPGREYRALPNAGIYLLRWQCWCGAVSVTPASVIVASADLTAANAVETLDMAADWSGTFDETETDTGALVLSRAGGLITTEAGATIQTEAGDLIAIDAPPTYAVTGTFEDSAVIDLGASYPVRIRAEIAWQGRGDQAVLNDWPVLADVGPLVPDLADGATVRVEVASKTGSPLPVLNDWPVLNDLGPLVPAAGDFGDWQDATAGLFVTSRTFKARLVLGSLRPDVTPRVTAASVVFDMPDRVARDSGVAIASGGTTITFSPAFAARPSINVTEVDGANARTLVLGSETAEGFFLQVQDASGTGVAATVDWTATGYGRRSA